MDRPVRKGPRAKPQDGATNANVPGPPDALRFQRNFTALVASQSPTATGLNIRCLFEPASRSPQKSSLPHLRTALSPALPQQFLAPPSVVRSFSFEVPYTEGTGWSLVHSGSERLH